MSGLQSKTAPLRIRAAYDAKQLKSFAFTHLSDEAPAITELGVRLRFVSRTRKSNAKSPFGLINEDKRGGNSQGSRGQPLETVNWDIF